MAVGSQINRSLFFLNLNAGVVAVAVVAKSSSTLKQDGSDIFPARFVIG